MKYILTSALAGLLFCSCSKPPPAASPGIEETEEQQEVGTAEIVRILEEEDIDITFTTHAQDIYIKLKDGRTYAGHYVQKDAGAYADHPDCFDILNLVVHIQEQRFPDGETTWKIACE